MAKLDAETILIKARQYIMANYEATRSAINTEKADGFNMKAIQSLAFVDQSLNDKVLNYDPFLFCYIDSVSSEVKGPSIAETLKIDCVLFVAGRGLEQSLGESLLNLRYSRLMRELGAGMWRKALPGVEYSMESLNPIDVSLDNSEDYHRVFGISVSVSVNY